MTATTLKKIGLRGLSAILCASMVTSCAMEEYPTRYPSSTSRSYPSSSSSGNSAAPLLIGAAALGAIAIASHNRHERQRRYNAVYYNRYGYDRYGYNRYGYNRYGYNRYGYNRYGYNRYGYDRHGYNRHGFNRYGQRCPVHYRHHVNTVVTHNTVITHKRPSHYQRYGHPRSVYSGHRGVTKYVKHSGNRPHKLPNVNHMRRGTMNPHHGNRTMNPHHRNQHRKGGGHKNLHPEVI